MLGDAVLRAFERGDGHALNGLGDAGVDVRLHAHEGVDDLRVAGGHADAPARHVVALGEGVELDADVYGALRLEEAGRAVTVEGDFAVGAIVADGDAVSLREVDDALEELDARDCARGVVRVVEPEELRAVGDVPRDGFEVGEEAVVFSQRQRVGRAAGEHDPDLVDGIGGVGDEGCVAGVDEAEGDVGDALLRADEGHELLFGVEGDAKASLVPLGGRAAEVGEAFGFRVAVVGGVAGGLAEGVDDVGRGGQVGVADAEGDDVDALGLLGRDLLGDLGEEVGRELLDAVGELHGSGPIHRGHRGHGWVWVSVGRGGCGVEEAGLIDVLFCGEFAFFLGF